MTMTATPQEQGTRLCLCGCSKTVTGWSYRLKQPHRWVSRTHYLKTVNKNMGFYHYHTEQTRRKMSLRRTWAFLSFWQILFPIRPASSQLQRRLKEKTVQETQVSITVLEMLCMVVIIHKRQNKEYQKRCVSYGPKGRKEEENN